MWFFRNKLIFNDDAVSSRKASYVISSFFDSWSTALTSEEAASKPLPPGKFAPKAPRVRPASCWSPPLPGRFKLNFDGSKLANGSASFGFVIRNSAGNHILVGARALGQNCSVLQDEAWGLKEGVTAAFSLNI